MKDTKNTKNTKNTKKSKKSECKSEKIDMANIKKKAKELGANVSKTMNKADIIRAIQTAEGNAPCFGAAPESCDQFNCCWRSECLPQKGCCCDNSYV